MQPVDSPQTCNNLSIESQVLARAKTKFTSAWSSWRLAKRRAIHAAFVPIDAPFRSQHVIWFTTAPSNSNCDHYCAHGPNIIAASQVHPSLMPDLGLVMATITSSKGLANVGVVAKHLQNMRHEMEQRKLELMGPKWNSDEATTTVKTKKPRLEKEHTTEPAGPDPGLQHTPVSPVLGPALQLQHTPRGPGQGQQQQQQQQHTPVAPAPGPAPALQLQVSPRCPGQGLQQQQQHTLVAPGPAPGPGPGPGPGPAPGPGPGPGPAPALQLQVTPRCPGQGQHQQQQHTLVAPGPAPGPGPGPAPGPGPGPGPGPAPGPGPGPGPAPALQLQVTPRCRGQGQQQQQHTLVAPGPALRLHITPRCPAKGQQQQQQQQQQNTLVAPAPGPAPALQLQFTPRCPGQGQQQQQHTLVASGPAPGPAPALQLYQLLQQQLLQPCPTVPPTLQQQQHLEPGRSHLNVPLMVATARRGSASGTVQPGVEEVASMGRGQVEKRAKTALALHAQDKSNIIINDALVAFLHRMQVLELPVTNTVYKQVYSAVNGQGFVCSVSRMER